MKFTKCIIHRNIGLGHLYMVHLCSSSILKRRKMAQFKGVPYKVNSCTKQLELFQQF